MFEIVKKLPAAMGAATHVRFYEKREDGTGLHLAWRLGVKVDGAFQAADPGPGYQDHGSRVISTEKDAEDPDAKSEHELFLAFVDTKRAGAASLGSSDFRDQDLGDYLARAGLLGKK